MYYMHLALEKRTSDHRAEPLILCVFLIFRSPRILGAVVHQSPKAEAAAEAYTASIDLTRADAVRDVRLRRVVWTHSRWRSGADDRQAPGACIAAPAVPRSSPSTAGCRPSRSSSERTAAHADTCRRQRVK